MIQLLGFRAVNIIVGSKSADGSKQTINFCACSRGTRAAHFLLGMSGMVWRRPAEGITGSCFVRLVENVPICPR